MVILDQTKLVRELCEITSSKRIYVADYQSDGIPFYRGKEIIEKQRGNWLVSTKLFISEEKFNEIKAKFGVPETGDVLLTSVGTLGVPYVVKKNDRFYFKDGNLTWFRKFNGLDSHYLYYWLLSPKGKAEIKKCTIGSSQPAFTIVLLKNMKIELLSIPKQQRIVKILSAYDDLIEINNRRIKILEEMARLIYKEWFVKFRFPGYEKVKMVENKLGMIPEGWEIKGIFDITTVRYGKNLPGKKMKKNGKYLVYGAAKVIGRYDEYNCVNPTVITGCRGSCGKMKITKPKSFVTNNSFIFDLLKEKKLFFYYQLMIRGLQDYIGGTAQPQITLESISGLTAMVPKEELLKRFNEIATSIFKQIDLFDDVNTNLRQTRDMLLPKLISGEIEVK